MTEDQLIVANYIKTLALEPNPVQQIRLMSGDKIAVIELGPDAVKFSGDLPVDDAAKLFFESVYGHYRREVLA